MIKTKTNSCGNRGSFTAATAKSQTKNLFSDVRSEWVAYASRRARPGNHMLYKMKLMFSSRAPIRLAASRLCTGGTRRMIKNCHIQNHANMLGGVRYFRYLCRVTSKININMLEAITNLLSNGLTVRQQDFVKSFIVIFPMVYCALDIYVPYFQLSDILTKCMPAVIVNDFVVGTFTGGATACQTRRVLFHWASHHELPALHRRGEAKSFFGRQLGVCLFCTL